MNANEIETTDINDGEAILFQLMLDLGWEAAAERVLRLTRERESEADRAGDDELAGDMADISNIFSALLCSHMFGHVAGQPVGLVNAELEFHRGVWTVARSDITCLTGYFFDPKPGEVPDGELPEPAVLVEPDLTGTIELHDPDYTVFALLIEVGWENAAPNAVEATERKRAAAAEVFDRERAAHWSDTADLMRTTLTRARLAMDGQSKTGLVFARLGWRDRYCVECRGVFHASDDLDGKSDPPSRPSGDPALN